MNLYKKNFNIQNVIRLANLDHKDNLGTKLLIIIGYYCSNWFQMKKARPAWYYWEYFAPQQIRLSPNLLGAVKEITVVNSGRVWTPSFLNTTSLKMDLDMQPPQRLGVALVWVARNKSRSSWAELGTSAVLLWLISAPQHTISQLALSSRLLACLGSAGMGCLSRVSITIWIMNIYQLGTRQHPG